MDVKKAFIMTSSKKISWLYSLMYLIMLGAHSVSMHQMPGLYSVVYVLRIIIFVSSIWIFFRAGFHTNKIQRFLLVYLFFVATSSLINKSDERSAILSYIVTLVPLSIFMRRQYESSPKMLFKSLTRPLEWLIILNFVLVILYPDGVWQSYTDSGREKHIYFLGGNYNQMGSILLCACTTSVASAVYNNQFGLHYWIIIGVSIAQLLIVGSMTSVVGIITLAVAVMLISRRSSTWLLTLLIVLFLLYQTFITFFLDTFRQISWVQYFIQDVLDKELTFTGRDRIWESAKLLIEDRPIRGYGICSSDWYRDKFRYSTPHNLVYSLFLKGGVFLFITTVCMVVNVIKKVYKSKGNVAFIFAIGLMVYLIMQVTEVYSFTYLAYLCMVIFLFANNRTIYERH